MAGGYDLLCLYNHHSIFIISFLHHTFVYKLVNIYLVRAKWQGPEKNGELRVGYFV